MNSTQTFDKEQFARLILDIAANYMSNYKYDVFYDIAKFRRIEEDKKPVVFTVYFRKTGCDTSSRDLTTQLFSYNTPELEDSLYNNNEIVIKVEYRTTDEYTITVKKNKFDYSLLYFIKKENV